MATYDGKSKISGERSVKSPKKMKIIQLVLVLFISACSALPVDAQGTFLPTQPAQTATASPIPEPTVNSMETIAVLQTSDANNAAQLLAARGQVLDEQGKQIGATQTVEYIDVLKLQATQTQAEYMRGRAPTDDEIARLNNKTVTVQATKSAQDIANEIERVEIAERYKFLESAPLRATGDFLVRFGVFLFFIGGAILAVVLINLNYIRIKEIEHRLKIEQEEAERIPELNEEIVTASHPAPITPLVATRKNPEPEASKIIPCTELEWSEFVKRHLSGTPLHFKMWDKDAFTISGYEMTRVMMRSSNWTDGKYSDNTLELTDEGEKVFIDWQNGDGLPEGYKFK